MTAEARITAVEAQVKAVLRGDTNILNCPYCRAKNQQPSELSDEPPPALCCVEFAHAVNAVMLKLETDFALDAAARIADSAVRSGCVN